eukprot:TRINITY_DN5545_c0_g1_i3.p1 TRINITY_DN5545_c0_g1~~TRINITY_DN5545_c0_g1_i3.p1  ORF type:complete len:657 (-),score=164.53 TRINITY_DN5545_c0_g1_i3:142-2112(-)
MADDGNPAALESPPPALVVTDGNGDDATDAEPRHRVTLQDIQQVIIGADQRCTLLGKVCDKQVAKNVDEVKLAQAIILVHLECQSVCRLLQWSVQCELERARAHPNTIFRANTLMVRVIANYIRLFGGQYLKDTLGTVIGKVIGFKKSLEVNPSLTDKKVGSSDLAKRFSIITGFADALLDDIFSSFGFMPFHLRILFSYIFGQVTETFPNMVSVGSTAVGGFLFLRFIGPAIVTPERYGLSASIPSLKAKRTLLILSKIIISLANSSQISDPHLDVLNKYTQKKQSKVIQWLYKVGSSPSEESATLNSLDTLPATPDALESLSVQSSVEYLHVVMYNNCDALIESLPQDEDEEERDRIVKALQDLKNTTNPPIVGQDMKPINKAMHSELIRTAGMQQAKHAKNAMHEELLRVSPAARRPTPPRTVTLPSVSVSEPSLSRQPMSARPQKEKEDKKGDASSPPRLSRKKSEKFSSTKLQKRALKHENSELRETANMLSERVKVLEMELSKSNNRNKRASVRMSATLHEQAQIEALSSGRDAATCAGCTALAMRVEELHTELSDMSRSLAILTGLCANIYKQGGGDPSALLGDVPSLTSSAPAPALTPPQRPPRHRRTASTGAIEAAASQLKQTSGSSRHGRTPSAGSAADAGADPDE